MKSGCVSLTHLRRRAYCFSETARPMWTSRARFTHAPPLWVATNTAHMAQRYMTSSLIIRHA